MQIPHTKSLHNYHGVYLCASTKLTFAFYFCTLQTVWTKVSLDLIWIQTIWYYDFISERIILRLFILKNATHKRLHNYQGVNLSASTKLSWQKEPEQINNPEQSAPRGAVWSGLSDCFLHHSRSAGRFHFTCRSHILKEFFPLKYIWDKQYYCILFGYTVDPEQLVSDEAVWSGSTFFLNRIKITVNLVLVRTLD